MEEKFITKAINWIRGKSYRRVKSKFEDFEDPISYARKSDDKELVPHFTGEKSSGKDYIDIGLKSDNKQSKISRWRLFSTLADMKNGKFILLVPRGHKAFVNRIMKRHDINAELVNI